MFKLGLHEVIRKYRPPSAPAVSHWTTSCDRASSWARFSSSASSATAIYYYCFHYHFFPRASAYGFPCIFHPLFYFNVDYFSMWFMFRLPDKKLLSKLVTYQPAERIPRVPSFQVRPLHRHLAPFMSIRWMAANSWSSQFGLGLQVRGYRAQQWHGTWGITVDSFFRCGSWCDMYSKLHDLLLSLSDYQ